MDTPTCQPQSARDELAFSVIIPVYNDPAGLALCLRAVSQQSLPHALFEVIVVDNGSDTPIRDIVSRFPFAKYVYEPKPGSYMARNTGVRHARGRYLAFTDADCVPDVDWLSASLQRFTSDQAAKVLGGKVEIFTSERPTASEAYEAVFGFRQSKYIAENGFAVTANLLVAKDVFERVGYFDSSLNSGGDRDWGHRLHIAGERIIYAPEARVLHPARATLRALIRKRRRVQAGRNAVPRITERLASWTAVKDSAQPTGFSMGAALLITPEHLGLTRLQGLQATLVAAALMLAGYYERLRLSLGGKPLR